MIIINNLFQAIIFFIILVFMLAGIILAIPFSIIIHLINGRNNQPESKEDQSNIIDFSKKDK